jgi:hypothetical protein
MPPIATINQSSHPWLSFMSLILLSEVRQLFESAVPCGKSCSRPRCCHFTKPSFVLYRETMFRWVLYVARTWSKISDTEGPDPEPPPEEPHALVT